MSPTKINAPAPNVMARETEEFASVLDSSINETKSHASVAGLHDYKTGVDEYETEADDSETQADDSETQADENGTEADDSETQADDIETQADENDTDADDNGTQADEERAGDRHAVFVVEKLSMKASRKNWGQARRIRPVDRAKQEPGVSQLWKRSCSKLQKHHHQVVF